MEQTLRERYGFSSFRPGQKEAIQSILIGTNTVAVLPTGTGKSLIYQFAGNELPGLTVVVSPLLSLMDNQIANLKASGEKRAAALNSSLSLEEKHLVYDFIHHLDFLFVSPEMLLSKRLLNKLERLRVGLFVVDEAHCISQWGVDFRPDYLFLNEARERLGRPLTLALTATASSEVIEDICSVLHLERAQTNILTNDPNRSNLYYYIDPVQLRTKDEQLLQWMGRVTPPGIIYFSSKKKAEEVKLLLQKETSLKVDTYHADRTMLDRSIIQRQFLADELNVICATTAFGMGVNKAAVRFVLHYHVPASLEEYVQEVGRAGRDGKQSIAILLYAKEDSIFKARKAGETDLSAQFMQRLERLPKGTNVALSDSDQAMWRIIQERNLSNEERNAFIEQRIQTRQQKVSLMEQFTNADFCLREKLSAYFDHKLDQRPTFCCSVCQSDPSLCLEKISSQTTIHQKTSTVSFWKEKVKLLFDF